MYINNYFFPLLVGKIMPNTPNVVGASLPKITPSLSLSKMQNVIPNLTGSSTLTTTTHSTSMSHNGPSSAVGGAMNQVGGAMNQMGQAAGGLMSGVFGMVKDAAAAVTPGSEGVTGTTTTTSSVNRSGVATKPTFPHIVPTVKATTTGTQGYTSFAPYTRSGTMTTATQPQQQQQLHMMPQATGQMPINPVPPHPVPSHSQVYYIMMFFSKIQK